MKTILLRLLSISLLAILPACSKKPVNVTGQIFVVTKGRENIKMGGVNVSVIPDAEFQSMARTTASWMQEEARNEAQSRADADCMTAFIKEVIAMEEAAPYPIPGLESIRMEIVKESGTAERLATSALLPNLLKRSFAKLLQESSSTAAVSTDADGRFTFPINGKTWFLAAAERAVGKESEEYLWVKSYEAPEGAESTTMAISNDADIDSEDLLHGVLNHSIGASGGLENFRKVEVSEKMTKLVAKYREAAKEAKAKAEQEAAVRAQAEQEAAEAKAKADQESERSAREESMAKSNALADKRMALNVNGCPRQSVHERKNQELLTIGGNALAWGGNDEEWLAPKDLSGVVAISAGSNHSLALKKDGTVVAWVYRDGDWCDVPKDLRDVVAISAGCHSLALKKDGTVVAWGNNDYHQCAVPKDLRDVVAISAGTFHSLALKIDGTVVVWGDEKPVVYKFPKNLCDVVAISVGEYHNIALKKDGTVVAWGSNQEGQLNIPKDLRDVVAISAGLCHSLALKKDGTVVAWGGNFRSQCSVPKNLRDVVAISASGHYCLVLKKDGTVAAWGDNWNGQCNIPTLRNVVAISAGSSRCYAITLGNKPED